MDSVKLSAGGGGEHVGLSNYKKADFFTVKLPRALTLNLDRDSIREEKCNQCSPST